jgi:ATP-dependent RNA helicase DDX18/HAS1
LKADEARTLGKSLSKKPRVLVLVPTGELAAQVLGNFRALSKGGVPCRSIVITGGFKWKTQVESLEGGADVVVATPGRLLQLLESGNIHFDNLKSVVLDEVDVLFDDEDFSKALETINKAASIKVQYIHVTATLPVDIHDDLLERYPDCLSLMGPSLHRTAIGLQEVDLVQFLLPSCKDALFIVFA